MEVSLILRLSLGLGLRLSLGGRRRMTGGHVDDMTQIKIEYTRCRR